MRARTARTAPLLGLLLGAALMFDATYDVAAAQAAEEETKTSEVKRDPAGQKGISPYNEDLAKGREAFAKGDHTAAIVHFDAAIAKDDSKALAYLLKGQSQLVKGELDPAAETTKTGKTKKATELLQSKLLFLSATIRERRAGGDVSTGAGNDSIKEALGNAWERVKESWSAYSVYLTAHSTLPNYKATADERKTKVDERLAREKKFGEVIARVKANAAAKKK